MIDAAINAGEFPFVQELPKREASKAMGVIEHYRELQRISQDEGMLIPQSYAAKVLRVHRSRVFQLVEDGRLKVVEVNGERYVTGNSVDAHLRSERKTGRPAKGSFLGDVKSGLALAHEFGKACVRGAEKSAK